MERQENPVNKKEFSGFKPVMLYISRSSSILDSKIDEIKNYLVEGDMRKEINMAIKRHIEIGTYRGARHRKGLPARGQRTRTNARTKRGKRKTVGLGKRKEEEKE